ncbi:SDR family NAD(P)-dependent oxidoreductase [Alicyclobacillus fastidiosus]|uniref:3-oxoacyl-ACP reductase family protein n=1 Tax=Alicyclobacillus fastidiosus TaxID=392011 RepID=A0ABV5A9S4_9BACL|nr:3-oxoacyl-ACP reductase family protein [Alicyclobacillus fastidiosus]WEH10936.1 3-oxoacyl-ACP reductase FabG [Alicyclobacillus fastidiosus]
MNVKYMELSGKIALVTGASGGIGRAVALDLAELGAKVAVNYLSNRDGADETVETIRKRGGHAVAIQADVTNEEQIQSLVEQTEKSFGDSIDILVNNTGTLVERRAVEDMTMDLWKQVMDVNVTSAVFTSKAVIPGMKAKGFGNIINLSSLAAHNGGGLRAIAYGASKGAIVTFTRGLARELAPYGIRVNCVAPGFIDDTKFHATFTTPEARDATIAGIPLGRAGVPQDVSRSIVFLATEQSSFITGETLDINGGVLMR